MWNSLVQTFATVVSIETAGDFGEIKRCAHDTTVDVENVQTSRFEMGRCIVRARDEELERDFVETSNEENYHTWLFVPSSIGSYKSLTLTNLDDRMSSTYSSLYTLTFGRSARAVGDQVGFHFRDYSSPLLCSPTQRTNLWV